MHCESVPFSNIIICTILKYWFALVPWNKFWGPKGDQWKSLILPLPKFAAGWKRRKKARGLALFPFPGVLYWLLSAHLRITTRKKRECRRRNYVLLIFNIHGWALCSENTFRVRDNTYRYLWQRPVQDKNVTLFVLKRAVSTQMTVNDFSQVVKQSKTNYSLENKIRTY